MKTTSIFYRARSPFMGSRAKESERRTKMWKHASSSVALSLIAAAAIGTNAAAAGPVQQRPIEDFVMAQGSLNPFAILAWTDPEEQLFTVFDYAGTLDAFFTLLTGGAVSFGTEMTGSVTERALPDGRALVHVRLKTTNAWSFAVDFTFTFPDGVVFGQDPFNTLMGAEPNGLGTSHLHLRFINTAPGAPLPDLLLLLMAPEPGQQLLFAQFVATAEGPLDDGIAMTPLDGTLGCLHTTQLNPLVPDNDLNNGVVAEFINITEGPCDE